jgi:monothiol glutaredoxin
MLMTTTTQKPTIVAWLKPSCGWSGGVRAVFKKYGLPFDDRDIINNYANYQEMVEKTGQMKQPCVEIGGHILADVSGEEIEAWMLQNGVVTPNDAVPEVPINQPCAHEMPGAQAAPAPMAFRR